MANRVQALNSPQKIESEKAEENILQLELNKLQIEGLQRIVQLWKLPFEKAKDRRSLIRKIAEAMQDSFYIKGVLEKLSSTQVTIYTSLLTSKNNMLTLGEIARKISMPPMNAEMELGVLKRYILVYQRKNRERLTNNLDRYHFFSENGKDINIKVNDRNKIFKLSLNDALLNQAMVAEWQKVLKKKTPSALFDEKTLNQANNTENLNKIIKALGDTEKEVIRECFRQGGILEMAKVREIVQSYNKDWTQIVRKVNALGILIDDYYFDVKFIRLLLMPLEVFEFLQRNPLENKLTKGILAGQSKQTSNDLDFFLNIKKVISYISRRGINLAKSGKIKQVDLRESERVLLNMDTALFIEKSQLYQLEILLPVMRLLDIVRIKHEDVVLRNEYEKILNIDYIPLIKQCIEVIIKARDRQTNYEDAFEALVAPFPHRDLWHECISYIHNNTQSNTKITSSVAMATIVRQHLILKNNFDIQTFPAQLNELYRELQSVLFYLQAFGLINVGYPQRWISLSELGNHVLSKKSFITKDQVGGIILNPDMSIIAMPEMLSLKSVLLLKTFGELKSFDRVFTFQITKNSFQNGILLKEKPEALIDLVKRCTRKAPSQNFLFSIESWSQSFPLIQITDECVLVQTKDSENMELLLGQLNGKRIIQEKIGANTILIHPSKISDVIGYAEKLDMLIKLIR